MSPKRGERVAPPAAGELWELRFATGEAAKGWDELCRQAPANTLVAYEELRRRAVVGESTTRHHRLKGRLATGVHNGVEMEHLVCDGHRAPHVVAEACGHRAPQTDRIVLPLC